MELSRFVTVVHDSILGHGEQNRGYNVKEHNKLYKKLVPKVTLFEAISQENKQCFVLQKAD